MTIFPQGETIHLKRMRKQPKRKQTVRLGAAGEVLRLKKKKRL